MAYFLGRDVKVAITTEHDAAQDDSSASTDYGITAAMTATGTANQMVVPSRDSDIFTPTNVQKTNPVTDVISVDVTVGAVDEDIAYMGQRTALKAEIKKENTVVITKKKDSTLFDDLFNVARYGLKTHGGTSPQTPVVMGQTTLAQPAQIHGYRVHVQLKAANEVITFRNMTMSEHTVTLNADGVQEESITFMGHVTPFVDTAATKTASSATTL